MKLWYTQWELADAKKEAQGIVDKINAELPLYINGNVTVRMAWSEAQRSPEITPLEECRMYGKSALKTFIPNAEILVNNEVCKQDLLDLILLDLYSLEMSVLLSGGESIWQ